MIGRLVLLAAAVAVVGVACESMPGPDRPLVPPGLRGGAPIEAVERPDEAACQAMLRGERQAAQRIREAIGQGVDGFDPGAGDRAAADPTASFDLVGIPLTLEEEAALRKAGLAGERHSPLAYWAETGAGERFGGLWIDPPGTDRFVVAIVGANLQTLRLARCLERPGLDVRYVSAVRSKAELTALQERVTRDWPELERLGIKIVSTGQTVLDAQFVLEIGVQDPTDAGRRILVERYGDAIVITDSEPVQVG